MTGGFRRSPGCNCCEAPFTCVLLEDTFDRADSDSLGSDWDEVSGDWDIVSNELACVTAGAARVTVDEPVAAAPHGEQIITAFVDYTPDASAYAELRGDWDDTAGSYRFGRFTVDSDGKLLVLIGSHDGTSETIHSGYRQINYWGIYDANWRLHLCCLADYVYFNVVPPGRTLATGIYHTAQIAAIGGKRNGVAATAGVEFNNYAASLVWRGAGDRVTCPQCGPGFSCPCAQYETYNVYTFFWGTTSYPAVGCENDCHEFGVYPAAPTLWVCEQILPCLWRSPEITTANGCVAWVTFETKFVNNQKYFLLILHVIRHDLGGSPPPEDLYVAYQQFSGGGIDPCIGPTVLWFGTPPPGATNCCGGMYATVEGV